jgi:cytochrome P450
MRGTMPAAVAFDPFEPGFTAWPYDQYQRLRVAEPVHWSELLCGWILTRYDDVSRILRDHAVSSELDRATPSEVVDLLLSRQGRSSHEGVTLVLRDDPDHARLRKLMQQPFTARAVEALRASVVARVDELLDDLAPRGEMELIGDFAYPLPVGVFCEMLGIPDEESPRFREWTAAVARSLDLVIEPDEYDACMRLLGEMERYLDEVADQKRTTPGDDVLTALVQAEVDGERLSRGELIAQLVTLYVAGHEPTTALIGNGIAALLAHPEQLALLHARPELIPHAVLELLRFDGPNQFVRRIATAPLTIGDRTIAPGDVLYLGVGAANHDPEHWGADGDVLDVTRSDATQHLQFGGGIHHCLGAHLARLQAEVALTALLTRLTDLSATGDIEWSPRMTLRSVAALPLSYRAA